MKKRLLITGGAGFIGVNAARHFLCAGWDVAILDNFSRKGTDTTIDTLLREYPAVPVVRADVARDFEILSAEVAKCDAVLHLAAQVAVTTSIQNPRADFEANILGTFNVLEAIRLSANRPPLIFASTNKVYGALERHPVRETATRYEFVDDALRTFGVPEESIAEHGSSPAPLDFHSPYGCSKGAADQYVVDYSRIYGLKTVSLRQSCVYGEYQFGVEDQGWVAWFTIAAMLNKPLTIYGTGKQMRDVLFVDDLVRLYQLIFDNIDRVSGRAYNVGGGAGNTLSLLELLDYIRTKFGYAVEPQYAAMRPGDQPIFVADVRALEKDLGWKPGTSPAEGLPRMHEWIQDNRAAIEEIFST